MFVFWTIFPGPFWETGQQTSLRISLIPVNKLFKGIFPHGARIWAWRMLGKWTWQKDGLFRLPRVMVQEHAPFHTRLDISTNYHDTELCRCKINDRPFHDWAVLKEQPNYPATKHLICAFRHTKRKCTICKSSTCDTPPWMCTISTKWQW